MGSGEGASRSSGVAVNEVQRHVVGEAPFSELAKDGVGRKLEISTMIIAVVEAVEDVVLVGETTISRNGTVILRSISVPTGQ